MDKSQRSYSSGEPIAIVGAGCRFPGNVTDMASYWKLLESGTDAVTSLPAGRFCLERYGSADRRLGGRSYTFAAGTIGDIKEFDADFFGISRKEALDMDPQQRLALETAWEAFEQAHIPPSSLRGTDAGVFIGVSNVDNSLQAPDDPAATSAYSMTGSNLSIIANRLSWFFDFHGPSMIVDTACSSSLVAVHTACENIRLGRIPLAVAGGVNILLAPYPFIGFSRARMLSPDGRCKVFDASGNGYVRGEGAGIVILKPLDLALRDNNSVLGLIAASGVNADGRTIGIALPNARAQAVLLRKTYADFGLDRTKLVYVEAHGTGTAAGDPVEASAIGEVLGKPLRGLRRLPVGSVKSNIGHLEPASGMAGLLKALLVLRHGKIPPNLHLNTPNPAIHFAELNIRVPRKLVSLPKAGGDELVGVNSFGFGGVNAHIVLRRAGNSRLRRPPAMRGAVPSPLFLSAAGAPALRRMAERYRELLEGASPDFCYDIAATLALEREILPVRAIVRGKSVPEIRANLRRAAQSETGGGASPARGDAAKAGGVFVFSGNGGQYPGMGAALARADSDFRRAVEEVDSLLTPLQGWPVTEAFLFPEKYREHAELTEKSQPLLFALQVGLVAALRAKGLEPSAVFGHSVGEVAAAWACGALSLKDAVTVIHHRSRLQAKTRNAGGMAVVSLPEEKARRILADIEGDIGIAAVNTGSSLTVAGENAALRAFLKLCKEGRIAAKKLNIPYPFHTAAMDGIREELSLALRGIRPRKPKIPFFSTVTGGLRDASLNGAYWWFNARRPVLFERAASSACDAGFRRFLEIGPAPVLGSYLRDILRGKQETARVLSTLSKGGNEAEEFEKAWKNAWLNGWPLDMGKHFPLPHARRDLPLYPWSREYLWTEETPECRGFLRSERLHPLLGWRLPGKAAVFENVILPADFPWLADHVVGRDILYPATAFLESMIAAAAVLHPEQRAELERVALFQSLPLADNAPRVVRLTVNGEDGGLLVESRPHMSAEPWGVCARARIPRAAESRSEPDVPVGRAEDFGLRMDGEALYRIAERHFLRYGPAFRTVECAWLRENGNEVLARFRATEPVDAGGMHIPPTVADGALQSLFLLLDGRGDFGAYLPVSFERVALCASGSPRFVHARLERLGPRSALASFRLLDERGAVLLLLDGCRFRRSARLEREIVPPEPYVTEFVPLPHPDAVEPLRNLPPAALTAVAREAARHIRIAPPSSPEKQPSPETLLQLAALACIHETVSSFLKSCQGVPDPSQQAWFGAMAERLKAAGLASSGGGRPEAAAPEDRPGADILWRTLMAAAPGYVSEATLLAHVFERNAKILAGEYAARENEILPSRLGERYFSDSQALKPFAAAARRCLASVLQCAEPGRPLNILCLGGHSAAMLPDILPLLDGGPHRFAVGVEDRAGAETHALRFGPAPGLRFFPLNPETPEKEHLGRYHFIFLAWAAHERLNSAAALEGCRAMLAPGGVVCLLEHAPSLFTDYVFGALPRYWAASPDSGQPASLLQGREYWRGSLEKAGFSEVTPVGDDDGTARACLLLGRGDPAENAQRGGPDPEPAPATPERGENRPPRWLIVAGAEGTRSYVLSTALLTALTKRGEAACLPDADARSVGDPAWWRSALAGPSGNTGNMPLRVVFFAGYDDRDDPSPEDFEAVQLAGTTGLAALARAWDSLRPDMRLWVVTGGALPGEWPRARPVPSQGALSGFARVLRNEMRGLETRLVDLHGEFEADPSLLPALLRELLCPTGEPEVVLAGESRRAPRLVRMPRQGHAGEGEGAVLAFDAPGSLRNLYWKGAPLPAPGPGEVRVEVKYAGLNFRDVMFCMGMLPDEMLEGGFSGPSLGMECSGVVDAVGGGVTGWKAGDEVVCFAPAAFGTHVVTSAAAVARKPANIGFAEAAGLPVAFITAWYSLKHLARMRPGERVLIHGACGGVGLAAIQVAAHLGLEIHATAGAPEKHAFLRRLGVKRLYSSRSLAFARQIPDATAGEGVDAVLNSLSGEAVPAGLSVLRPFGRFLELGKRDFYADSPLRLRPFSKNLSYFGIDVDQLLVRQPALAQSLFAELMDLFARRGFVPLPHTVWPATRCVEAFQAMQGSVHIGKLTVSLEGATRLARPADPARRGMVCSPDATYLVTGGSGGFGLASAARLAGRGAKNLLLVSRKGIREKEAGGIVRELREKGVRVVDARADAADAGSLRRCLKRHLKSLPPLRGVIHAATALDDGLVTGLTPERIRNSLAAKSLGAVNLHRLTLSLPLDFFALYSSAVTPFGNPGQAGYVAANCMLETLAAWRRARGLPAQVIGWGAIADTGMLTRNPRAREMLLKTLGVSPTRSADALDWLEHCIGEDIGASFFFGLDWRTRAHLPVLASPRFRRLRPAPQSDGREGGAADLSPERLRSLPLQESMALLTDALMDETANVLRLPRDRFTPDDPLAALGMDSLMAVELSLAVEQKFGLSDFSLSLSEKTTAKSLAQSLAEFLLSAPGDAAAADADTRMLHSLEQAHGAGLSGEMRDAVLRDMKEKTRE
ncbi:MAG: SDR family NAD(P)-dependent oxidoreductase [Desulfovibrio sp.]|nr:SDR family NAD(P)-dependent oxidoreductase [Desulfovibrio sp.]